MSARLRRPVARLRPSLDSIAVRAAVLVVLAAPAVARAQSTPVTPPAPSPAAPAPAAPPASPAGPIAGWNNGFFVQSANGDNRLQLGAVVQVDGRFSLDDPPAAISTFGLRRARTALSGRIAKYFDYRLMSDFGAGTVLLYDAYLDVRFSQKFRVRAGKDKTPVGYELLISDAALLFPERSLASTLVPNRDVGIQAQGDLAAGKVSYAGGVFNGVVDGVNSTADFDTNGGKDLAGRIVLQPFRKATTPAGALNGFGVQIGGTTGKQIGALPSFKTSASAVTYFSYAGAAGSTPAAVASGDRTRVTPAVFYFYKSFGAFGEFVQTTQAVTRGATSRDITNTGWDIAGSFFLTGEAASTGVPTPRSAFDPPSGKWGALQIVARYAELTIDNDAFDAGFAAAGASRIAKAATIGANWYPSQYVKYYLIYERTTFDGPTTRPTDNTALFRVQLAF